jgi:hypothetical protein
MKKATWSAVFLACWMTWLTGGMVWAERPQPEGRSTGKHRFGFLDRSGFESRQSAQSFHESELSDRVVYSAADRRRRECEAIVQGDHVAYHLIEHPGGLRILGFTGETTFRIYFQK